MASAVTPPSVETVESDAAYEVPDHEINEEPPEDALIYNQPKIAEKENQVAAETETLPKPQPQSVAEKAPTALMQAQEKTYESSAPPLVGDMGIWGPLHNIGDGFAAAISEPEKSFSSH